MIERVACAVLAVALLVAPAQAQNANPIYAPAPPQARIQVFVGANYRGQALALGNSIGDLAQLGMARRIGSIIIQSGRWQVCSGVGFTGTCRVFNQSSRDLRRFGWGGRIVSIRRIDV